MFPGFFLSISRMRCIFLTLTGWRKMIDSMKPKKVGPGVSEFNLLHGGGGDVVGVGGDGGGGDGGDGGDSGADGGADGGDGGDSGAGGGADGGDSGAGGGADGGDGSGVAGDHDCLN